MKSMATWKLVPTGKPSVQNEGLGCEGDVIAQARSEAEARELADCAFRLPLMARRGQDSPLSPWKDPELVSCIKIAESGVDDSGICKVISPPHDDPEHRQGG